MKARNLRLLLCAYAGVILMSIGADCLMHDRMIPLSVREHADHTPPFLSIPGVPTSVGQLPAVGLGLFIVLTVVVGWIGMFLLWSAARYIFFVGVILAITFNAICTWTVVTGLDCLCVQAETLLSGIIIALVLWGPAKPLFVK